MIHRRGALLLFLLPDSADAEEEAVAVGVAVVVGVVVVVGVGVDVVVVGSVWQRLAGFGSVWQRLAVFGTVRQGGAGTSAPCLTDINPSGGDSGLCRLSKR